MYCILNLIHFLQTQSKIAFFFYLLYFLSLHQETGATVFVPYYFFKIKTLVSYYWYEKISQ